MSTPKLLYFFLLLTIPSSVVAYLARPGCKDTCGNVSIPFPFGIGSRCSINDWYLIDCTESNGSFTPRLWINGSNTYVEVLNISLTSRTITVKTREKRSCSTAKEVAVTGNGLNLGGSPFFFSKEENKFVLFGCGISLLHQHNTTLSGCMSTCVEAMRDINSCYGIGCCETRVPYYLSDYNTNFTSEGFEYSVNFSRLCISTFLADRDWFPDILVNPFNGSHQSVYVDVALSWTIGDQDFQAISACNPQSSSIHLVSGEFRTWTCPCSSNQLEDPQINPYLNGQCIDSSEKKKNLTAAIIGISSSLGVLLLAAAIFTSYKLLRRRRNQIKSEKFFKRNGGLLLQNKLYSKDSVIEKTRIFTALELEKATDNFNETRILGRGSQGTVYKGMLSDGRIVAIKKSKQVSERQLEQFINEVLVLSQVVHKNVVTLLGCCLETEVPLLVYEFVPNGTLYSLIHTKNDGFLTWNIRLRIAIEVAAALAYLHSAVSIPVYHRDIKSSNILLDEKCSPKISDFGISKCIALDNDQTHITTIVKGTFGYLDPEYFQSSQFTEKSDVYSFGVVLAELLTKQKAVCMGPEGEDSRLSLATRFLECMEENCLETILDPQVIDHGNKEEIMDVAKLAEKCLNLNGKKRPTMTEVAMELGRIRMSRSKPDTDADSSSSIEEDAESCYDAYCKWPRESSSTTPTSVVDTKPFLFETHTL